MRACVRPSSSSDFAIAAPVLPSAGDAAVRPFGPGPSVEIVPIESLPQDWAAAWDDLARDASEPSIFVERWFVLPGIRHLAPGSGTRMLAVWQGRRLIGLIPLGIDSHYGRAPIRNVQNWRHHHNFLGSPLVRAGHERLFWTAILEALDQADWAPGFLHLSAMAEGGPLLAGLRAAGRPVDVVHVRHRAMLQSDLGAQAYYEATVRKKKRKEIGRLASRLAELGAVEYGHFRRGEDLSAWCDDFLALEMSGWKGRAGSALGSAPETEAFLREMVVGAEAEGRLDFLRLTLDGKPIAMLLNLLAPPGSFSFKIAFDEEYARFSPGVLIQLENLKILERRGIAWMDSCAVENHSMINSLWGERRTIVRVTVPLAGLRRRLAFALCRAAERGLGLARRLHAPKSAPPARDDE